MDFAIKNYKLREENWVNMGGGEYIKFELLFFNKHNFVKVDQILGYWNNRSEIMTNCRHKYYPNSRWRKANMYVKPRTTAWGL